MLFPKSEGASCIWENPVMKTSLDARLLAAANFVRDGAYLADIGTDHAYLPIYLAQNGKISRAVASDIRKGRLRVPSGIFVRPDFPTKIETVLTDGLSGLERYPITDIVIAGRRAYDRSILDAADFIRTAKLRLILQPMQHIPELRRYLSAGWLVEKEAITEENGKLYQILCARYDGVKRNPSALELLLGSYNLVHKREIPLFSALCKRQAVVLSEKIAGLERGGHDASAEKGNAPRHPRGAYGY